MQASAGREKRLTRVMVSKRLNVSLATVVRWQKTGILPYTVRVIGPGPNGRVYLTPESAVEELIITRAPTPRSAGEVAARAFELFELGKNLREVVKLTHQHPDVIRELYSDWLKPLEEGENERLEHQAQIAARRALRLNKDPKSEVELAKFEADMKEKGKGRKNHGG